MEKKFTRKITLQGAMFLYLKTAIQKGLVLAILLIGVYSSGWAQCEGDEVNLPAAFDAGTVAADGSTGTGGLTFADGSAATWNIANSSTPALQGFSNGLSTTGELYFYYDGTNDFDLTTTFDVTGIPAGKVVKLRLYGSVQRPSGNNTFGAKFGDYTISWVGGVGNATIVDTEPVIDNTGAVGVAVIDPVTGLPATQIVGGGGPLANGGMFAQTYDPDSPTGAIPNGDLEWYVDFPAGATSFTITAEDGRDKEGFRFSAIECDACLDCDYFDDPNRDLCAYLTEYETDNGVPSALATLDCDGGGIDNQTECDDGGDPFDAVDDCPDLTLIVAGDFDIGVTESICNDFGGAPSGGLTAAPVMACPTGSTLMYSTDSGASWSDILPTYDQTTAITVDTRCECDSDDTAVSAISTVTTIPGPCPDCPDLSNIAAGNLDIGVVESICTDFGGSPTGGSTAAPAVACPAGSTLEYSLDAFATPGTATLPAYDDDLAITVSTRCACDAVPATVSATSTVTTVPGPCPACPDLSGISAGDLDIGVVESTCMGGPTLGGGSTTAPATACPAGSTLMYSDDSGATWSGTLPTYDQNTAISVWTRCECDAEPASVSAISNVVTEPGTLPDCGSPFPANKN